MGRYFERSISTIRLPAELSIVDFVDERGEARTGFTAPLEKWSWLLKLTKLAKGE